MELTIASDDCRQPNWSPAGNLILYQRQVSGQWDIWVMNTDGSNKTQITSGTGDKTDASFSPDGQWIVYSSDEMGLDYANLFIISITGGASIRITNYSGYDGAPSWSSKDTIVFESYPSDPDGSPGTSIWMIDISQIMQGMEKVNNTSNNKITIFPNITSDIIKLNINAKENCKCSVKIINANHKIKLIE